MDGTATPSAIHSATHTTTKMDKINCTQCDREIDAVYRDGHPTSHNEWLHPVTQDPLAVCYDCDPVEDCLSSDVVDLLSEDDPFYYR